MSTDATRDTATVPGPRPGAEPLDATVVRYKNGPDRCTVAPADVSDDQRLTAWLSVDADALVALREMR
ncbi:MAG: hypothetical protein ABEH83_05700 [Halobacterium sp.]